MSEYQYYEFAAIDESLTEKQMQELRALSTRAEITPTSFVNEYHWGDFKGDPRKLIAGYFDVFLYYANWGTLWCMFRLPRAAVDLAALKPFKTADTIEVVSKRKSVIVDICINDEPGDYDVPYNVTLARLISARTALLEGDVGPMYVAWLAAVQRYLVDDDTSEPCDASQLEPMGAGTRALAHFLSVNDTLLRTAFGNAEKYVRVDQPSQLAKWARSLPQKERDEYLVSFIAEPANVVRSKLIKQFRASRSTHTVPKMTVPRTAAELRAAAAMD